MTPCSRRRGGEASLHCCHVLPSLRTAASKLNVGECAWAIVEVDEVHAVSAMQWVQWVVTVAVTVGSPLLSTDAAVSTVLRSFHSALRACTLIRWKVTPISLLLARLQARQLSTAAWTVHSNLRTAARREPSAGSALRPAHHLSRGRYTNFARSRILVTRTTGHRESRPAQLP